ncbi:MAG: hypothetical protein LBU57_07920 [Dysgonamonadaceae bacterium]|jgi:hypothetical protein|nr:hypothetical protein [Dysgonamonadaceae bacterium]
MYYVVKYSGPFGFIKPWTAVRDSKTFSMQFLTPSIVEGIEKKLFPELLSENGKISKIVRHKLVYSSVNVQQEQTQSRGWEKKTQTKTMIRPKSILERGILIDPTLYLAFEHRDDTEVACKQHICLCRNEDILFPSEESEMTEEDFNNLSGFELRFGKNEKAFLVGFNRFDNVHPMYGWLEITGKPVYGL